MTIPAVRLNAWNMLNGRRNYARILSITARRPMESGVGIYSSSVVTFKENTQKLSFPRLHRKYPPFIHEWV